MRKVKVKDLKEGDRLVRTVKKVGTIGADTLGIHRVVLDGGNAYETRAEFMLANDEVEVLE